MCFVGLLNFVGALGILFLERMLHLKMLEFMFGRAVASEKLCSKKLVL